MPRDERSGRIRIGVLMVFVGVVLFIALFILGQTKNAFTDKVTIYTDFAVASGLREGSSVELAGVKVGRVDEIDYVRVRYQCDMETEDIGRYGAGRTDNCDNRLFCTPQAHCGQLEPIADDYHYTRCVDGRDCEDDEICVTSQFRRRKPQVIWMGPHGVCARYTTQHPRVRVFLEIEAEHLPLVRRDSRASITGSVLGGQAITMTLGIGDGVEANERILSVPALSDDIQLYSLRLERVIDKIDQSLAAITGLVTELADERTLNAIKGLAGNLEKISLALAERRGLVGALIGSPAYKRDIGMILRSLGATTDGIDRLVGHSNGILATTDRNLNAVLEELQVTSQVLGELIDELRDPANQSVVANLINDPSGELVKDLHAIFEQTAQVTTALSQMAQVVDQGEGTLGKVLGDAKLAHDVGRLLNNLKNMDVLQGVLLWALEKQGVGIKASRKPSRPAGKGGPGWSLNR